MQLLGEGIFLVSSLVTDLTRLENSLEVDDAIHLSGDVVEIHTFATVFLAILDGGDGDATPVECFHGLLECIHFENIDGESLQRFFRLPKLGEILKIDEVKQCAFDGFLEDVRAFKRSYSAFRDFNSDHLNDYYSEIIVKK